MGGVKSEVGGTNIDNMASSVLYYIYSTTKKNPFIFILQISVYNYCQEVIDKGKNTLGRAAMVKISLHDQHEQ